MDSGSTTDLGHANKSDIAVPGWALTADTAKKVRPEIFGFSQTEKRFSPHFAGC